MKLLKFAFRNLKYCFLLNLLLSLDVSGCECPALESINHYQLYAYEKAELVQIVHKKYLSDSLVELSYNVKEHFFPMDQGELHGKIRIEINPSNCQFNFQKGDIWLWYFNKSNDEFYISYCGHSSKFSNPSRKKEELHFLRNYSTIPDSSVCPNVSLVDEFENSDELMKTLAEIKATISYDKRIFLKLNLNKDGEIYNATLAKEAIGLSEESLKNILEKVNSIKGLKPAEINNYRVNVSMIVTM